METVEWTDSLGRKWLSRIPNPGTDPRHGFQVGPPDLEGLGLPHVVTVRLHNELFARRLFTAEEAKRRRMDVLAAIQSALKVDVEDIVNLYQTEKE